MAKNKRDEEIVFEKKEEMSLEEARAYRASLAPPKVEIPLSESQRREEFRKYWAQKKSWFGKGKEIEPIIWTHLKAIGMDHPEKFEDGLKHFGLEKVK